MQREAGARVGSVAPKPGGAAVGDYDRLPAQEGAEHSVHMHISGLALEAHSTPQPFASARGRETA